MGIIPLENKKASMKAIIYLRTSTNEQNLEHQQKICEIEARKLGITKKLIFADIGVSGSLPITQRKGLLDALHSLQQNDVFIVSNIDRIARDIFILQSVKNIVEGLKAKLISVTDQERLIDFETILIQSQILDIFSKFERDIIKRRTKFALEQKKLKGEVYGNLPFGFCKTKNKIHFKKDKKEQKIIKIVQSLRIRNYTFAKISDYLKLKKFKNRRGNNFSIPQIEKISSINKIQVDKPNSNILKDFIKQLRSMGYSLRNIVKMVNKKGFRNSKGNFFALNQIVRILKKQ